MHARGATAWRQHSPGTGAQAASLVALAGAVVLRVWLSVAVRVGCAFGCACWVCVLVVRCGCAVWMCVWDVRGGCTLCAVWMRGLDVCVVAMMMGQIASFGVSVIGGHVQVFVYHFRKGERWPGANFLA